MTVKLSRSRADTDGRFRMLPKETRMPLRVERPSSGSRALVRLPLPGGRVVELAIAVDDRTIDIEVVDPPPVDVLDALTPREREVAQLVATGLSNAEAAARLGVSTITIGCHLVSVYRKLRLFGRIELAALVLLAEPSFERAALTELTQAPSARSVRARSPRGRKPSREGAGIATTRPGS